MTDTRNAKSAELDAAPFATPAQISHFARVSHLPGSASPLEPSQFATQTLTRKGAWLAFGGLVLKTLEEAAKPRPR